MKKHISILFMTLAVFTMTVHAVIPHHEHGYIVCFEQTACEDSHCENEETKHSCCLDRQDIFRAQNEKDSTNAYECSSRQICSYHFPPIILFSGNFFDWDVTDTKQCAKPYINLYTSVEAHSIHSLRAPPQA